MAAAELNRILMVEDEADIQKIAALALEVVGGFTVRMCSSGREAVACAAEFQPDLILLDVLMAGMDGPATLRALRELPALAMTPVIFMTARAQPHQVQEYRDMGSWGIIEKPFDAMRLAHEVRAIWAQHHG